ncbi:10295_t:CDS:10, partial [Entrophospora sp. SA101]
MTDGGMLRESLKEPDLDHYSTVIMDKAHECSLQTDVLMGLLRQVITRRRDLKLIVTSATMNTEKFAAFFGNCAIFTIPGRTFPVDTMFSKTPCEDYVDSAVKQVLEIHLSRPAGDILERVEHSDAAREKFFVPESDHLTLLHVYTQWKSNEYQCVSKAQEVRSQLIDIMKAEKMELVSCGTNWDVVRKCTVPGENNVFEQELEKKLYDTLKAAPELNNGNKNLCRISKYKIARGGSHIKTPKAIANKATNKSNADRLIEGKQTHLEHLSILKNYTHLVNFESILDGKPVPVSKNVFEKLEKRNATNHNIEVNLMVLTEETIADVGNTSHQKKYLKSIKSIAMPIQNAVFLPLHTLPFPAPLEALLHRMACFHQAARIKGIGEYVNICTGMPCHLHPTSALYGLGYKPDYIVYHELVMTSKEYMQCVTAVDPYWLAEMGPMFYSVKENNFTQK